MFSFSFLSLTKYIDGGYSIDVPHNPGDWVVAVTGETLLQTVCLYVAHRLGYDLDSSSYLWQVEGEI